MDFSSSCTTDIAPNIRRLFIKVHIWLTHVYKSHWRRYQRSL